MIKASSKPKSIHVFGIMPLAKINPGHYQRTTTVRATKGDGSGVEFPNDPQDPAVYWVLGRIAILDPRGFSIIFTHKETQVVKGFLATDNKFKSPMIWAVVDRRLALVPFDVQVGTPAPVPLTLVADMPVGSIYKVPENQTIDHAVVVANMQCINLSTLVGGSSSTYQSRIAIHRFVDGSEDVVRTNGTAGVVTGSMDATPLLATVDGMLGSGFYVSRNSSPVLKYSHEASLDEVAAHATKPKYIFQLIENPSSSMWVCGEKVIEACGNLLHEYYHELKIPSLRSTGRLTRIKAFTVG